jgi:multiple sugar transport system substrate-binding protein
MENTDKRVKQTFGLRKILFLCLVLAMTVSLLAACSQGGDDSTAEKRVLRIGTLYGGPQDEPYFRQQYTDSYELTHPNIDIEIVPAINYNNQRFDQQTPNQKQPDPMEELRKMMNGSNPVDVVVIDFPMLRRLVQDNMLKQLDPLIQKEKLDLSDYVPSVMDGLKDAGEGNLFALTPTFSSSALFYNKKLFTAAGVDLPTDGMTWDQAFALAGRVAAGKGKDRKYGFLFNRYNGDGYWDTQIYAAPLQLKIFDDKAEKMQVNNTQWERVWSTVAKLYKDDIVPDQEDIQKLQPAQENGKEMIYNPVQGDMFLNGNVAMVIGEYGYISEITNTNDNAAKIKGFTPVDWDVVTVPQWQEKPNIGGNVYLSSTMGINAKAQNPDDAWEFIKFMNSREWAELKSRSTYELPARQEFLKPKGGATFNMAAFTTLKPVPAQSLEQEKIMRERPNLGRVNEPAYQLFQEVIKGTKTAKQALTEWETQGNALLQKIKANPDGQLDPIEGGVGGMIYGKG